MDSEDRIPSRALLVRCVAGALTVAALVAVVALLQGDFSDTDLRVLATTLGFSTFSATAGAGEKARTHPLGPQRLGAATVVASALAFVALVLALWVIDDDVAWQAFGALGLGALAGSHGSLVLSARRPDDTPLIEGLAAISVVLAFAEAIGGALPVLGIVDGVSDAGVQALAIAGIAVLLTSALPPILRRGRRAPATGATAGRAPTAAHAAFGTPRADALQRLATEIIAAADRADGDADGAAVELRRLRQLARDVSPGR